MLESHFWESLRVLATAAASTSMRELSLSRASLMAVLMQTPLFKLSLDSISFQVQHIDAYDLRLSLDAAAEESKHEVGELAPVIAVAAEVDELCARGQAPSRRAPQQSKTTTRLLTPGDRRSGRDR